MDFKEELISSIKKQLNEPFTLEIPPSLEMGNFSLPCFKLSKKAPELQKLLKLPSFIEKTEIKGQYLPQECEGYQLPQRGSALLWPR